MKVIQTDNQIALKTSGIGQLLIGLVMIAGGIAVAVLLPGSTDDTGKKMPGWVILIGVAMALGGIAIVLFSKNRSVSIVKGGDTTVSARKILGGGPQSQTVPTANITAVRLSTYVDNTASNDGGGVSPNNSRRSTLSLVLNNNDLIEIGSSGGGLGGFTVNGMNVGSLISKAPLSKEAEQLTNFLGVPLQADDTSSIVGAVKSLKTAIGQTREQPSTVPQPTTPAPQTPAPNPAPQPSSSPQPPQTPAQSPPPQDPANPGPPPPYQGQS